MIIAANKAERAEVRTIMCRDTIIWVNVESVQATEEKESGKTPAGIQ